MSILTAADLKSHSDAELSMLVWKLNIVVAGAKPFSREWRAAQSGIDTVLTERCRRLAPARRSWLTG